MGTILASIFASLLGKLLSWCKQQELEAQAALAEELKQHVASIQEAQASEAAVAAAVQNHQEAAAVVTGLEEQLAALNAWNQKSKNLQYRIRSIRKTGGR